MSLEIIPFRMEHLDQIILRPSDKEHAELFKTIYSGNEDRFRAFTMVNKDVLPVAICGMTMYWPSVAGAFMAFSESVDSDPEVARKVFWGIKGFVKQIFRWYKLHRMEAATPSFCESRLRWMKLLGFKAEGVMQKYDAQGRDYTLFAKVI
jgi:hypothetical protein